MVDFSILPNATGYFAPSRFEAEIFDCEVQGHIPEHPNTIRRMSFDLRSNTDQVEEGLLFDTEVTSFTRIDERYTGHPNRYIYVQFADRTRPFNGDLPQDQGRSQPNNSVARFDLITRERTSFWAGPHHMLQEPTFVPRSSGAAEGDGWLLVTAHDLAHQRAELLILDAPTMTEVGRVRLPFRNAQQVHGMWANESMLPLA